MPLEIYLLDTDICSYLISNRYSVLNQKLLSIPPQNLAVSAVTRAESWFGYSWRDVGLRRRLVAESFFQNVQILDWPAGAAPIYGTLRARLMKAGVDIGLNDVMIAAHAIAIDATLITNNTDHFSRIGPPLRIENWLQA